jgi:predicted DNA-binding protein (MmcQ/YjbR family)
MNIEELRNYCISKKGVSEGFPFNETTLVFKVMGKMFALTNLEGDLRISLKCDPEKAIELRERYSCVLPGYHMNKQQWNTILVDGSVPNQLILNWIDNSYKLIVEKLPKKQQAELAKL